MKSKISIIVPIYNVEKYLDRCITSILNQSYFNIEIILINDGSTDNSLNICNKYQKKDNRILIINQDNQGLSAARNQGINIASGEYFGFIDGDDWIEKDMFKSLYTNMKMFNADISVCGYRRIDEEIIPNIGDIKYNNANIQVLKDKDIIKHNLFDYTKENRITDAAWDKIFKRSLFENIRFPPNKIAEDVFTAYLLLDKAKTVVISPNKYYNYVKRSNSITSRPISVNIFDWVEANTERYSYVKLKYPEFEPLCRKQLLISILFVLLKFNNYTEIKENEELINKLIECVKNYNIYTCKLTNESINLLELFQQNTKEWYVGIKIFKNSLKKTFV